MSSHLVQNDAGQAVEHLAMQTKYALQPLYPHEASAKGISKDEFDGLYKAVRGTFACLAMEEKFGYVLSNFRELELSMLHASFDAMTTESFGWSEGISTIQGIAVRLLNLLSSCRLYQDQSSVAFKKLFGRKSPQVVALDLAKNAEKNKYASYRIMEALRNHCQHCEVPVYGITHGGGWDGPHCEHLCILKLDRLRLLNDRQIEDQAKADIAALEDQFDVRPIVREYVASLARVHETVQRETSPFATSYQAAVDQCISEFNPGSNKRQIVHAEKWEDGRRTESFSIFSAPAARRELLSHSRRFTKYVAQHFVSNRLVPSTEVDRTVGMT